MRANRSLSAAATLVVVLVTSSAALPAYGRGPETATPPGVGAAFETPEPVIPNAVPVESEEEAVELTTRGAAAAPLASLPSGTIPALSTATQVTAAAPTGGDVAVVGITWDVAGDEPDVIAYLRSRSDGAWSAWQEMEVDDNVAGPRPSQARAGTEPIVVLEADAVEVALAVPAGAEIGQPVLSVWDPGTSPADSEATAGIGLGGSGSVVPGALVAPPTVYTRADWGADESQMTWLPKARRVTGAVVHHTASSNGYSADQVPAILRGIYAYHAKTRGWGDIGYNVVVDRFGRAWEGRAGGLTRAIAGGHAVGYNDDTMGVSALGNFEEVAVPEAMFDMLARVLAWKFDLHGVNPQGTTTVGGKVVPTIQGHRDTASTACPGANLYSRLAELRRRVAGYEPGLAPISGALTRDLSGDGVSDLVLRTTSNAVQLWSTAGGPTWEPRAQVGSAWSGIDALAPGDWTGDGSRDLMARTGDGALWLYPGTSSGSFGARVQIGSGWQSLDLVTSGHDWDGDGDPDILARSASSGSLVLYPADGRGGFDPARTIGAGWQGMNSITLVDRFAEGKPAVLARDSSTGNLYAYPGTGDGAFQGSRALVGPGWGTTNPVVGAGDWTGDGRGDVVARNSAGTLLLYAGTGASGLQSGVEIGTGWNGMSAVLAGGASGSGQALLAVDSAGALWRYVYLGESAGGARSTGITLAATDRDVFPAGDWDGDGRPDLAVRTSDGRLMLHRGLGGGSFAASGSQIGTGWQGFDRVVAGGDWLGTGRPTLVTYVGSTGQISLYPGDGRGDFGAMRVIGTGYTGYDAGTFTSVGIWNRNVHTASLALRGASSKNLFTLSGVGTFAMTGHTQVGTGWGDMTAILGFGDATGDGNPDVVGVTSSRGVVVFPGNGRGGFLSSRAVGTVPAGVSAVS